MSVVPGREQSPMDAIPSSTVVEVPTVVLNPIEPVTNDVVAPPVVAAKAPKPSTQLTVYKAKKGKGVDGEAKWDPKEFYKDAAFFALIFGLPNEGDSPHRITDVSDVELQKYFGPCTKNGYKLNNVVGIPVEDILALSQVVDGYEKPVNGILSHTFVKGVYVEWIQNRKVYWCSYASTKLKGQVSQWCRDLKGKLDGPPCVRKAARYVRPSKVVRPGTPACVKSEGNISMEACPVLLGPPVSIPKSVDIVSMPERPASIQPPLQSPPLSSPIAAGRNLLLTVMETEMLKMRKKVEEIGEQIGKVEGSIDKLKQAGTDYKNLEQTMTEQIEAIRRKEDKLKRDLLNEEELIEDLTTDIELEMEKGEGDGQEEEEPSDLLKYMRTQMETHKSAVESLKTQISSTHIFFTKSVQELDSHLARAPDIPAMLSRMSRIATSLAVERGKLQSALHSQEDEYEIVADIFATPCPFVIPQYTLTPVETALTVIKVGPCPICCNGYHCFNWVPASCGHTYHPACLFAAVGGSKDSPKCFACGEPFSINWLRTWGFDRGQDLKVGTEMAKGHDTMAMELEELYGRDCNSLAQRQLFALFRNKLQENDAVGSAERTIAAINLTELIDEGNKDEGGDDGTSKKALLSPKIEGESKRKRKLEVEQTKSKVKLSATRAHPTLDKLTPSATLPFSPEAEVTFRTYCSLKSPLPSGPISSQDKEPAGAKLKKKLELP